MKINVLGVVKMFCGRHVIICCQQTKIFSRKSRWTKNEPRNAICTLLAIFFFLCINETTSHILWRCLASNDVWAGCNRKIQKYSNEKDNFICILDKLMTKIDEEDFWFCRNMVVFGGELTHSSQLVGCTEESLKEFHQAPSRPRIQVEDDRVSTNLVWRTPHWVWQR